MTTCVGKKRRETAASSSGYTLVKNKRWPRKMKKFAVTILPEVKNGMVSAMIAMRGANIVLRVFQGAFSRMM